jgi:hypothetical protein
VDDSLRGENVPQHISLDTLTELSPIRQQLMDGRTDLLQPEVQTARWEELTSGDREILASIGIKNSGLVLSRILEAGRPRELVIAAKPSLADSDRETVGMFVLHAGLVMENLNLSRKFKDKSRRLSLIHDICFKLASAPLPWPEPSPSAKPWTTWRESWKCPRFPCTPMPRTTGNSV